jgi:DNA-binding GntR family transcriptional regulator
VSARAVIPFEPRVSAITPLTRTTAVDELAAALRTRILDGDLTGGARLVEQELCAVYDVARHTARAALRALQAEGLVVVEAHRGARVARLDADAVRGLYELRAALEVEAARLALERHEGRLPEPVHDALAQLVSVCSQRRPGWSEVAFAHDGLHRALVEASGSTRIAAAHAALEGEMRLFLVQLRPAWTLDRLADGHTALVAGLEQRGPEALREHLREAADAVLALVAEGA